MESWELKEVIEKKEKELFFTKLSGETSLKELEEKERELKMLKELYWRLIECDSLLLQ